MTGEGASEALSAALAQRLALQMSVSSLPVIEEWMDAPMTRWLDSVPLPMETPDGSSPILSVALGCDGQLVRWSAGAAPEAIIPKLVDYLRRSGAHPVDFQLVDQTGHVLEPAVVGTWIEVRPGALATGWSFEDRMPLPRLLELLGESGWADPLADATCTRVLRGIGADPVVEIAVEVAGEDPARRAAEAASIARAFGFPLDGVDALAASGPADGRLALAVRARKGQVEAVRVTAARPRAGAAAALCASLGLALVPAIEAVERSIAAEGMAALEIERVAAGSSVIVGLAAGTGAARPGAN